MLQLPTRVTADEAVATQALLAAAVKREPASEVVVDASTLQHFDSAALAVLLACQRLATTAGKAFSVHGTPLKLVSLARLYGIDGLFRLADPVALPTPEGGSLSA